MDGRQRRAAMLDVIADHIPMRVRAYGSSRKVTP